MLNFKNLKQKFHTVHIKKFELPSESRAIINNLKNTKQELDSLNHNISYITDPILLNQMIFQLRAAEVRYQYWFCMAKEMNISTNLTVI